MGFRELLMFKEPYTERSAQDVVVNGTLTFWWLLPRCACLVYLCGTGVSFRRQGTNSSAYAAFQGSHPGLLYHLAPSKHI